MQVFSGRINSLQVSYFYFNSVILFASPIYSFCMTSYLHVLYLNTNTKSIGFESLPPTKLDLKMVNTHVYGTYTTSKLAAHYFSRQSTDKNDRCLILVGSVMSYLDTYGAVGYGLAKHAIRGLMGVLRRRRFMRVNMIAPWYSYPFSLI